MGGSFNPPVGILPAYTGACAIGAALPYQFQSPSRDSACLYRGAHYGPDARQDVSIPQSGFCLLIPRTEAMLSGCCVVFQSPSRDSACLYLDYDVLLNPRPDSFNPPVGILPAYTLAR